jgi:hypothetical protein
MIINVFLVTLAVKHVLHLHLIVPLVHKDSFSLILLVLETVLLHFIKIPQILIVFLATLIALNAMDLLLINALNVLLTISFIKLNALKIVLLDLILITILFLVKHALSLALNALILLPASHVLYLTISYLIKNVN